MPGDSCRLLVVSLAAFLGMNRIKGVNGELWNFSTSCLDRLVFFSCWEGHSSCISIQQSSDISLFVNLMQVHPILLPPCQPRLCAHPSRRFSSLQSVCAVEVIRVRHALRDIIIAYATQYYKRRLEHQQSRMSKRQNITSLPQKEHRLSIRRTTALTSPCFTVQEWRDACSVLLHRFPTDVSVPFTDTIPADAPPAYTLKRMSTDGTRLAHIR
eukprot:3899384-Amphidinium_carterae.1